MLYLSIILIIHGIQRCLTFIVCLSLKDLPHSLQIIKTHPTPKCLFRPFYFLNLAHALHDAPHNFYTGHNMSTQSFYKPNIEPVVVLSYFHIGGQGIRQLWLRYTSPFPKPFFNNIMSYSSKYYYIIVTNHLFLCLDLFFPGFSFFVSLGVIYVVLRKSQLWHMI